MARMRILVFVAFCLPIAVFAQVGGGSTYSFLNIPASARVAAMGGTFISVKDDDLNVALQNPSLLNPSMNKFLALSGVNFPGEIKFGDAAFAKDMAKLGTFDAYVHYATYGTFNETDETGVIIGSFHASDFAFGFGWGYQLNKLFSVGANLKGVYSDYYIEHSLGLAGDLGATLYDSTLGLTATIVAKNVGSQLKKYTKDVSEPLPTEVQAGVSKRFMHVPFRINLTARHLEKFDLTYVDPNDQSNIDPLTGEFVPANVSFGTKLLRHVIVGGEILITKNFNLDVAYNFQRRSELTIDTKSGTIGLSFGASIKISKFIISYGRAAYSFGSSSNHFSISTNLGEFLTKKG